jgi:hypothetical protein
MNGGENNQVMQGGLNELLEEWREISQFRKKKVR